MIQIQNLSKEYKESKALHALNLTISNGIFGLLGPNGAGKTTLMRILATLLEPSNGDVVLNSVSLVSNPEKIRKHIGYLPQHFHVYPQLTPIEVLDYVAVMKGLNNKNARKEEISHWLEEVNLQHKAKDKIKTFSHGMKQRLGIAQAFIAKPCVVILDEPTVGLDPEERLRFRNLLSKEGRDKCILLSTHVVTDIESSCYEIGVLKEGRLILDGTVEDLKEEAEGKVWHGEVPATHITHFKNEIILSIEQHGDYVKARILSDEKPFYGATLDKATLEDGYLALLGGLS
ncbi:ABC transporter ATP-binding protein [Sutcliffiella halmapala]|uniref:ABC transporter ATP-binding protein n=1 Tax=Sutcliffiella halmapala TaxID=79882 RepID=UPI000994BBAA|nr:ABC transporter ATP-binding protein [Sutcliffiella halmapala]